MGLILNRLTTKFNTGSVKIINANSFVVDSLTKKILEVLSSYPEVDENGDYQSASSESYINEIVYKYGFEITDYDVEINENTFVIDFINSLNGKVDDETLKNILNTASLSSEEKSIPAILMATIINNSLNNNLDKEDEIIDIFSYAVSKLEPISLQDLSIDVLDILKDIPKSKEYFNRTYISFSDLSANAWYDFTKFPAEEMEDMVDSLQINNTDELLEAVKNIKNLPSVISYIKENYTKADQGELLREYKALAILTNIYNDKKYKEDPSFDQNNNIGLNLSMKLIKTQKMIEGDDFDQMENTNLIVAIKNGAKSVVNRKIIKKCPADVYKKYLPSPVKAFISKYERIENKIEQLSFTQTVRDSLVDLGLIKRRTQEKELVANQEYLLEKIEDKISKAQRLLSYLNAKNIDKLEKNPALKQMYKEILDWASFTKNTEDEALIIAKRNGISLYKDYVFLSQPANVIKKQNKINSQSVANNSSSTTDNEPTQLSLDI